MDDFRTQLSAVIDEMLARGVEPVFMVVELEGMEDIKRTQGAESVEKFRAGAIGAITTAGHGCDAFSYGEDRIVAVLGGFDRLRTFAMADKLRRGLPFLAQSFDCTIQPEFEILEYDASTGVAGLIHQLVTGKQRKQDKAREVA